MFFALTSLIKNEYATVTSIAEEEIIKENSGIKAMEHVANDKETRRSTRPKITNFKLVNFVRFKN